MPGPRYDTPDKLQPSRLNSQLELMDVDVDLSGIRLSNGSKSIPIAPLAVDGTVRRTIEGASTIDITIADRDGIVANSGLLGAKIDIKLDGLYFRLCGVTKNDKVLKLTFEDREVAILRTYNKKKTVAWGKTTRTRFAKSLIDEVKELKIPFICPELKSQKPVAKSGDLTSTEDKNTFRDSGLGAANDPGIGDRANVHRDRFTIKGVAASKQQLDNVETVLDVGVSMKARRKVLVAAIMTIIQESSAINLRSGDQDSLGLFQQRPSQGWGTPAQILDPAQAANSFFARAITSDAGDPDQTYAELAQSVQRSAFPDAYAKWRTEAERLVTAYGVVGGDAESPAALAAGNNMIPWEAVTTVTSTADQFQFTRGHPTVGRGGKHKWDTENSWDCLQRLAEEVDWRCFCVSGSVYFISEKQLFKSAPRGRLSEKSEGIDYINYDYVPGKKSAKVTITCRISRWAAPPGSVIELYDSGPVNGRWIVSDITRNIFSTSGTITLKKPRAALPEPSNPADQGTLWDNPWTDAPDPGAPNPGSIHDPPLPPGEVAPATGFICPPVANRRSREPYGHFTSNLPGYPAVDIMCPGYAFVLAPESGTVTHQSGHSPALYDGSSIMGYSIQIQGASGTAYFLTHMGEVVPEGTQIVVGQIIGKIAPWPGDPGRTHLHFAIREGSPYTLSDFAKLSAVIVPTSP